MSSAFLPPRARCRILNRDSPDDGGLCGSSKYHFCGAHERPKEKGFGRSDDGQAFRNPGAIDFDRAKRVRLLVIALDQTARTASEHASEMPAVGDHWESAGLKILYGS